VGTEGRVRLWRKEPKNKIKFKRAEEKQRKGEAREDAFFFFGRI
jgi:hypothetical protein